MKYGSLEWANDLLNHAKSELDKINAADEKGKAAAEGLGLTQYYTNLIKSLEDEIGKGNYKPEDNLESLGTDNDANESKEINAGPTGIADPADYMQKITFEDSDENGKPEKVTVEKNDTEVSDKREKIIDKRVKNMKDGWGKTKVMKDKEKEAREKDVCE